MGNTYYFVASGRLASAHQRQRSSEAFALLLGAVVRTQQQKTFLDIRGWDPEGAPLEPAFRVLRLGLENEEKKHFFFFDPLWDSPPPV